MDWRAIDRGDFGLSGTDGQVMGLARWLSHPDRAQVELCVFVSGGLLQDAPFEVQPVEDLSEAVREAGRRGSAVLLANDRNDAETLPGLSAARQVDLPIVIWAQNGPYGEIRDRIASIEQVRRVVCVSLRHADQLRDHESFRKCAVVHNALWWPEIFERDDSSDRRGVVFLGATVYEKGFHHLVRAWSEVRRRIPEASLTILGSAHLYDRFKTLGAWGLADEAFERKYIYPHWGESGDQATRLGVRTVGLLGTREIADELRQHMLAVVNPWVRRGGSFETFCVSAVEAQAAGCVVVGGGRVGLLETVRDGRTGILIRRQDQLASAISTLLCSPRAVQAMSQEARGWSRRAFAASTSGSQWMRLFLEVIAGGAPQPPQLVFRRATARVLLKEVRRRMLGRRRARPAPGDVDP